MVEPVFFREFPNVPNSGETVELSGSEGKHAATVRRMRVGEAIVLTDGRGLKVRGSVVEVDTKSLSVLVSEVSRDEPNANQLILIQALAKGDRDELAIQAATELGVTRVIPWQAERSISRWDAAKAAKGKSRWQLICDEASKQSLRVNFPEVADLMDSSAVARAVPSFDAVLILDPTSKQGLSSIPSFQGRVALVVGPEGGISEDELALFEKAGAVRVHLGESILRTSTAPVAAIAAIQALSGQYGSN